jgi:hypothetical protein
MILLPSAKEGVVRKINIPETSFLNPTWPGAGSKSEKSMAERTQIESAYLKIREQAVNALRRTSAEILARESELDELRKQEQQISGLFEPVRGPERQGASGQRTNWGTVLEQLPGEFKASDVRKVRGIGEKPSSEIFAAITRWIMAKAIKRKERGVYQRVG